CSWILQGDDCIFYISVVYWKATETTLTKGGTNGTDAKDDPPGKALGPVRRGQLGLHPADLHHPAHLLQRAGRGGGADRRRIPGLLGVRGLLCDGGGGGAGPHPGGGGRPARHEKEAVRPVLGGGHRRLRGDGAGAVLGVV